MKFLRYPGGKSKQLSFLVNHLPNSKNISGRYIEPFVGGGSVFLYIRPYDAFISDLNSELIDLYNGIKKSPKRVWEIFESFPSGKKSYYKVRDKYNEDEKYYYKAARTLYLNRTCFKGMWRHDPEGKFNVGYGGEERRWVITQKNLEELSSIFQNAVIQNMDFEDVIKHTYKNDFIFLDPPYKPGEKDLHELHYISGKFLYNEQVRLAETLKGIPKSRRVRWAMTNSSHKDIVKLYKGFNITGIPIGTSDRPGIQTKNSKEVLITNY